MRKAALPVTRWLGVLTRVRTAADAFALTFDDGPHSVWTPRFLEVLARHGAHATFFVVGAAAERHPEILHRIRTEGHALGNHTWNHPSLPRISRAEIRRQLDWTRGCAALAGSRLFRPPFGDLDWRARLMLLGRGTRVVTWDVGVSDWKARSARDIADDLLKRTRRGSIVLLHDQLFAYDRNDERDRACLLEALDEFLARTELQAVTVPELVKLGRPVCRIWRKESDPLWLQALASDNSLGFRYREA